jgi:hypothetical protein
MAWLWRDDAEYREGICPAQRDRGQPVRLTHRETWFSLLAHLGEAASNLQRTIDDLRQLGFGTAKPLTDRALLDQARPLTWDLVRAGETLLLYHKRLALSDHAYDFLHAHEVDKHWDRYAESDRVFSEVSDLVDAAEKLLEGYHQLQAEDERFLDHLELPSELLADFVLCRNLFSVGLDELGVFAAGRGFEGVLRTIAKRRKIVTTKGLAAAEASLAELIECFARLQLAGGRPLIEKDTRSLLDYARNSRNATAHPHGRKRQTARQLADVIASEAQHLWDTCKRARFATNPKATAKQRIASTPSQP